MLYTRVCVRAQILADLGSQRDRVALSIAQKLAKVKEVELAARIKEVRARARPMNASLWHMA